VADSRVASPAADAQAAGAASARVLVPKTLPEGAGDPMQSLVRAIDKEVAAAAKGAGASLVVYADTTTDYGCLCPPFVFAPFHNSGRTDSYVLPVFARGVPDPPLSKVGLYRFFGHFDGRRITGFEWLKARGGKRSEGMSEYERKAPVFVVEGWCFEPDADFGAHFKEEVYRPTLEKMAKDGRFCPGAKFPASVPE
jgi:hypothetical protein